MLSEIIAISDFAAPTSLEVEIVRQHISLLIGHITTRIRQWKRMFFAVKQAFVGREEIQLS